MSKRLASSKPNHKTKEILSQTEAQNNKDKKRNEGSPISKASISLTSSFKKANNRSTIANSDENINFNLFDSTPEARNPEKELKIVSQENKILRKKLQEAQARISLLTKELAEAQHTCSLSELQTKRNDVKMKEFNTKLNRENEKIQELCFQNSQMTEEIAQLRINIQDERVSAQEKFEALKKSFQSNLEKNDNKVKGCMNLIKSLKVALRNTDAMTVMARAKPSLTQKQNAVSNIKPLQMLSRMEKILEGRADGFEERDEVFEDYEEHTDLLQSLREMLENSEREVQILREKLLDCQERLEEEINKNEHIVPQYKLALNKLRANTDVLKKRFEEIHSKKSEEKEAFKKERVFLVDMNEKYKHENERLLDGNEQLQRKLKETFRQLDEREEALHALKQEIGLVYKKLESYQETVREQDAMIKVLKETLEARAREEMRSVKEERIKEMIEKRERRLKANESKSDQKKAREKESSPHFSQQKFSRRYESLEEEPNIRKNKGKMPFDSNRMFGKKSGGEILIDDDDDTSYSKESERAYTPDLSKSKSSAHLYSSKKKKGLYEPSDESKTLKDYLCYSDTEEDDQSGRASWLKAKEERNDEENLMNDIKTLDEEIAEIQNCLAQELTQNI